MGRAIRILRRTRNAGAVVLVAVITSTAAFAWFSSVGSGTSGASVGALVPSSITAAIPGAGTVALNWSAVTSPGSGAVSYYVTRNGASAGGNCPTASSPSTVTSCTDSGLAAGTYHYAVVAVWRTWTATSTTSTITVASGALDHFVLSAATTTPTAGAPDSLTISAKDSAGVTVTSYTADHSLTFGGAHTAPDGTHVPTVTNKSGSAVAFGSATTITFTNGVATVSGSSNGAMTLYKSETAMITVTDGSISNGTGLAVTVSSGSAASLSLNAASTTPTAGAADNLTITAKDAFGNTATGYTGSKSLTFSGAGAIGAFTPTLTNSSGARIGFGSSTAITFASGVATVSGSSNGVMTLYKAETASIVVSDGTLTNGSGLPVTVSSAAAATLAFTQQPTGSTGGVAFPTQPKVSLLDQYGNTQASNSSTVTLAITSGTGSTGATLTCTTNPLAASGGVASFSGCKIDKAGSGYTLTATDGTLTSAVSTAFNIAVGPAAKLAFTQQPAGAVAGTAFTTQPIVALQDAGGNTVTSDTSSVTLAIGSGTGTSGAALTCTTNPLAAGGGLASFSGCKIDKGGTGYTLTATDGTLTAATSAAFDVTSIVTATKVTSHTNTTGGSNTTTTGPFTGVSGATYLVLIQHQDGVATGIGASVSGTPLSSVSQIGTTNNFRNNSYLYAFRATGTGSTGTITATFTGTNPNNQATLVEVIQLSGNNTTTPIAQSNTTAAGTSSPATATLTSPNTQNGEVALVGMQGTGGGGTTITAPSGYTQLDLQAGGQSGGWTTGAYIDSSAQATSSFALGVNKPWGTITLEINHA